MLRNGLFVFFYKNLWDEYILYLPIQSPTPPTPSFTLCMLIILYGNTLNVFIFVFNGCVWEREGTFSVTFEYLIMCYISSSVYV
jgi:hypothetical protein